MNNQKYSIFVKEHCINDDAFASIDDLILQLNKIKDQYGSGYNFNVLTLKVKQVHYTLDLFEHAKDAMNAAKFDIPVDCKYYESVDVGDELEDSFRMGSLIIRGSFGDWSVTVNDKKKVVITD